MTAVYRFGAFQIDEAARRLSRDGESLPVPDRHLSVLLDLVSHPGVVRSKDTLVAAGWGDVAVTDNSLEQAISALRRTLGGGPGAQHYIQTVPRQGYRFAGEVSRGVARVTDESLEALLAPHRAFVEGRAALETLERTAVARARDVFARVLQAVPEQASAHVGLANACVMQFEATRADPAPDLDALDAACRHAREACRLEPGSGEAWATLGFVLDRAGRRGDAAAAARRAIAIEPDNWRHQMRLSYVSWGEERLRAAHRTLALLPGFPLAHWLGATVHVARGALDAAERELRAGIAAIEAPAWNGRFSAVALHWLLGLVHLARRRDGEAMKAFERELARESGGHLYARECCANTWYAIGALRLRRRDTSGAAAAFEEALGRVAAHPMARAALEVSCGREERERGESSAGIDAALALAARCALEGRHDEAARVVDEALSRSEPGTSAGWILPVEPLLDAGSRPDAWASPLARLRARAA